MTDRNIDNTAVVTGAAGGIGKAITERLLSDGWIVWALDLCRNGLNDLEKSINSRFLRTAKVDISDESENVDFFQDKSKFKNGLNAVVNNAAVQGGEPIGIQSRENWQHFLDVNVTGAWLVIRHALPFLNLDSSIVNVGSVASVSGFAERTAYCASKHAQLGLTRALALELAPKRIRVNSLCLGSIDTPALQANAAKSGRHLQDFADRQLVGRLGLPSEAAAACSFLVSNQSCYMTGTNLTLDGGMLIKS